MPSTAAIVAKQAQDLRAQTLSTLMATVDAVDGVAKVIGNLTGNTEAEMQSVDAAIRAVIIENSGNGRAILQVPGGMVEAELPPALLRAALTNPNLLKPGSTVLLPADSPARALPPATTVAISSPATGPSVGPAPPLASPFPPGTLGAVIARLAGIAFPQAEPEALTAPNLPAGTPSLRPGMLSQPMPTEVAEALLRAASRQMPLASAVTQILAISEAEMAHMPPDLAAAIRALQQVRATPDALRTSEGVQNAVKLSGLFLESNLAQTTSGQSAPTDLKSILLAIRALVGVDGLPHAEPGQGKPAAPNELAGRNAPQEAAARPPSERLPELARAVEGAVERVKLMQLASMPEHPEIRVTDDRAQPMRLALSIPIATQGHDRPPTAVMGLMIEHRPPTTEVAPYAAEKEGSGDTEPFPWKVRIALDLEETGPVQAEIALRGQSVAVTLWAERTSMASLARDSIGDLHEALTGAAFDVFKLEVKDGRPLGKPSPRGPVLDRRT